MKIKSRKQINLDLEMIEIFIKGHSYESLLDDYQGSPFRDEAHKRSMWDAHKGYILKTYLDRVPTPDDENTFPSGTRPWAWWQFEHDMEPPGYGETDYICGCRAKQTAYLKEHNLLESGEEFQARTNAQMHNMKHGFRLNEKSEIRVT